MSGPEERPTPAALGRHGLWVPPEEAAELAAALRLYLDLLAGRVPPGSCRNARPSPALMAVAAAAAVVARQHAAEQHRQRATAAAGSALSAPVPPSAVVTGPSGQATVTVEQAATRLGLAPRHVRQLAASGLISGTRGDRNVWHLDSSSVAAYRPRRTRRARGEGTVGSAAESAAAAAGGAQGG